MAPRSAEDDVTTFGVGQEDLTIVPPTSDVTIAPPPSTRAAESDATVVTPGRPPSTDFNEGFTLAPRTRPPARTATRRATPRSGEEGPLGVGEPFGTRYHIIRLLGIGGMGAVYQAWDDELGVAVAIKVIRPEVMEDPTAAAEIERRFKRELLLARQVTHKNVVRIHDLGEIDGIKYITMPYVDGDDLATIRKRDGRMPVSRVLRIARSVIGGLVEAHKAGVVHRDLKPANIMIGPEDEAMIMDFGIARSTGAPTSGAVPGADTIVRSLRNVTGTSLRSATGTNLDSTTYGAVVGTVEYMAPEQAKGQPVDQRADVYAFGLILYDLITGERRGKPGEHPITELQGRMKQAPPAVKTLVPEVPEHVDQIVSRCLEPEADKRFQTSEEVAAALALLDDEGIPIPIPPRFSKKMIATAASLVLSLVTSTWYFTRTPPPVKPHDPVSVLIADFENKTGDPTFEHTLESVLKLALEGAGFISAYDRSGVRALSGVAPEKLDVNTAQEIAVKAGLGVVVRGSLEQQGSGYVISLAAMQPLNGTQLGSATGRASAKDQVLGATAKLATDVRKALGDRTSESAQAAAIDTLSATSLDAIRQYSMATEALNNSKYDDALSNYSKAVALDPKFGMGYLGMAQVSRNLDKPQDAEKYIKEALRYVDGMTERERYRARGFFYRMTGDYKACVKEYGDLVAKYAADVPAHNQLALCSTFLRKMPEAINEMRQILQLLPNSVFHRINLALYECYGNEFQGCENDARTVKEPRVFAVVALAFAQLAQGKSAEATETYRQLSTINAQGASYAAAGLGDIAMYEGRLADAVRILDEGAATDLSAKSPARAAAKFVALAEAQNLLGRKAPAAAAAEKALANSQTIPIRFLAARALVEAGQNARAKAVAATLAAEIQAEPQAYAKIIDGEIAFKSGDRREGIKLVAEANELLDTWIGHFVLGRVYLETGQFTQADSEFDRCMKRRGEALSLFLDEQPTYRYFPSVYYYQGRSREGLNSAGFAESYREYLKIRGNSKDDPLVPDVRKRAAN
jgi:serine/threonine protein kinase/tetratricopeptide (TPR) repeat protein